MLNFDFIEKGLGIFFLPHFVYNFSGKMFLILYSINLPNSMSDFFYFLRYWAKCIVTVCFPGYDIINLEIYLIFLIKLFFYMNERLRQNFKYLEYKNIFRVI